MPLLAKLLADLQDSRFDMMVVPLVWHIATGDMFVYIRYKRGGEV